MSTDAETVTLLERARHDWLTAACYALRGIRQIPPECLLYDIETVLRADLTPQQKVEALREVLADGGAA